MDLIRKHLMLEGQMEKDCLIRILDQVKAIYRKSEARALWSKFHH